MVKKFKKLNGKASEGYFIIEAMIALTVMAIIAGIFSNILGSVQNSYRNKKTKENQEAIVRQMAFFLSDQGNLPPPGNPKSPYTVIPFLTGNKKTIGIVPFTYLGLQEQVAKDGYGRWFTYIANPHSVTAMCSGSTEILCQDFFNGNKQTLFVKRKEEELHETAFVIISHGPSGRGAFSVAGERNPINSSDSACKQKNCSDTLFVCAYPDKSDSGKFDDIVRVVSIKEILSEAGVKCIDVLYDEKEKNIEKQLNPQKKPPKSRHFTPDVQIFREHRRQ